MMYVLSLHSLTFPLPGALYTPNCLLAKQAADSPQHAVLLGVVGVIFAGDLEDGWECRRVCVDSVPNSVSNLPKV